MKWLKYEEDLLAEQIDFYGENNNIDFACEVASTYLQRTPSACKAKWNRMKNSAVLVHKTKTEKKKMTIFEKIKGFFFKKNYAF